MSPPAAREVPSVPGRSILANGFSTDDDGSEAATEAGSKWSTVADLPVGEIFADDVAADAVLLVEPAFTPGGNSDSTACGSDSDVAGCSTVGCGS